jgi:alpha,alpha-trehalase
MSYQGLKSYGKESLADTLRTRWIKTIQNQYLESGKLLEKYNVVFPKIAGGGGEYPTQDGFGWTNGIYLRMLEEL